MMHNYEPHCEVDGHPRGWHVEIHIVDAWFNMETFEARRPSIPTLMCLHPIHGPKGRICGKPEVCFPTIPRHPSPGGIVSTNSKPVG